VHVCDQKYNSDLNRAAINHCKSVYAGAPGRRDIATTLLRARCRAFSVWNPDEVQEFLSSQASLIEPEQEHAAVARDVHMAWGTEKEGFGLLHVKELMLRDPELARFVEGADLVESGMNPCMYGQTNSRQHFGDMVLLPSSGESTDVLELTGASPDAVVVKSEPGNVRRTLAVIEVKTKSPFHMERAGHPGGVFFYLA
jgi:hypothetical protein